MSSHSIYTEIGALASSSSVTQGFTELEGVLRSVVVVERAAADVTTVLIEGESEAVEMEEVDAVVRPEAAGKSWFARRLSEDWKL